MLLQLAAAGLTAATVSAARHNLTGLWTSDSTLSSGPWTDRYALTEAAGAHTASVLCEYGGLPPSCSNVTHGQGGARPEAFTIVVLSSLAHSPTLRVVYRRVAHRDDLRDSRRQPLDHVRLWADAPRHSPCQRHSHQLGG